jgi:hypothetical protein
MVRLVEEGLFPYPRPTLWKFLDLHTRDDLIHEIHPGVLEQRTLRHKGEEFLFARTLNARGKYRAVKWRITSKAPDWLRWEITEAPEGPMTPGSYVMNRYSEAPGGTHVATEIEITVRGVPGFLQRRVVRRVLDDIDAEDLAYLKAHPIA